jgi:hypothetical protein
VIFLIVGETGDSPDKLKFCWQHNNATVGDVVGVPLALWLDVQGESVVRVGYQRIHFPQKSRRCYGTTCHAVCCHRADGSGRLRSPRKGTKKRKGQKYFVT